MSTNRRFYSDQQLGETSRHVLEGSEHQHLAKVLRAQPGDQVVLFDGSGCEFQATIQAIRRNQTELCVDSRREINRELSFELMLAVALPKGDRQQWLVEKAVELGVTTLVPLKTEFGVAQPGDKARHRMSRWIVAASKQCGRNVLMRIGEPITARQLFATSPNESLFVAHPTNAVGIRSKLTNCLPTGPITAAIGPEGGFSAAEVELAKGHDCQIVSLGPRILRIETAAVALVCTLIYALQNA